MYKSSKLRFLIISVIIVFSMLTTLYVGAYDWPASTNITSEQQIIMTGLIDKPVSFSAQDIELRICATYNTLRSITITTPPSENLGELSLFKKKVKPFEKILRNDINSLIFTPKAGVTSANISFIPESTTTQRTVMTIKLIDTVNNPPEVESQKYSTGKNIPLSGVLTVYEPEDEKIQIKLLSKPKKGDIEITTTDFMYKPYLDMTGSDKFTFCAVDESGNYSREAIVDITIDKSTIQGFTDMQTHPSQFAALKLREKGIISGEKVGEKLFFYPARQVTRGEFIVMLITAAKLDKALETVVNTELPNDSDIPLHLKPYIKKALNNNIISKTNFNFNEIPTRAEAVLITTKTAKIPNVKISNLMMSDLDQIPSWAIQSYINLNSYKMLDLPDGKAYPNIALSRSYTADLLWQLWKYIDSTPEK